MKKQTFILSVWCGTENYRDAEGCNKDFFRFSCKKAETVKKYLCGYVTQAKDKGLEFLYPFFFAEGGRYMIENTPDGYNTRKKEESGFIKDL